jgi:hypothetical protein
MIDNAAGLSEVLSRRRPLCLFSSAGPQVYSEHYTASIGIEYRELQPLFAVEHELTELKGVVLLPHDAAPRKRALIAVTCDRNRVWYLWRRDFGSRILWQVQSSRSFAKPLISFLVYVHTNCQSLETSCCSPIPLKWSSSKPANRLSIRVFSTTASRRTLRDDV